MYSYYTLQSVYSCIGIHIGFFVCIFSSDMNLGIGVCCRCGEGFGQHQQIVNSNGEVWHPQCFV